MGSPQASAGQSLLAARVGYAFSSTTTKYGNNPATACQGLRARQMATKSQFTASSQNKKVAESLSQCVTNAPNVGAAEAEV